MKISDIMKSKKNYAFYTPEDYGRDFPRIYTGIFTFDYCTAGIPVGVTTSFYGGPGAGKSSSSTKLLGMAQKTCWNCFEFLWDCKCKEQKQKKSVVVTTEKFDYDWAANLGVDINELIVAEPATGEEAVDIIYEVLNADDCGLLVLDSLARIIPEQEITDPALSYQVGMRARLHAKLMNKVKSTLIVKKRKNEHAAFVATNQIRSLFGSRIPGAEDQPGGFASKHDWHLTCRLGALKPEAQFIDGPTDLPNFSKHSLSLVSPGIKRKVFTLAGKGHFYIALEDNAECAKGDSYDMKTAFEYAVRWGLLDKKDWSFLGVNYGTKKAIMEHWKAEPFQYLTAKRRIIEHIANVKRGIVEDISPKEKEEDNKKKEAPSD
jgi:recombination protein RecA